MCVSWGGGGGGGGWACKCSDPQSVSVDLSNHKEHQY